MKVAATIERAITKILDSGDEIVKQVTYVRPTGLNPLAGTVTLNEIRASLKALVPSYAPGGVPGPRLWRARAQVLVKAADLATVPKPVAGDYVVLPDGTRMNVERAENILDAAFGLFCMETPDEDYADLTAATTNVDHGDLTAITALEDFGTV